MEEEQSPEREVFTVASGPKAGLTVTLVQRNGSNCRVELPDGERVYLRTRLLVPAVNAVADAS